MSTDPCEQIVSIFILSITLAFRLLFCQIHVMLSKMDAAYLTLVCVAVNKIAGLADVSRHLAGQSKYF